MSSQLTPTVPATVAGTVRRPRTTRPRRRGGDARVAAFFLFPAAVGFVLFFLWPTVRGIWLSLTDFNLFGRGEFVGVDNYVDIAQDDLFWNSMLVTLYYVVLNIGFQTAIALGLAVLMQRLTTSLLVRICLLLPYLVANVVVALLWFWLLDFQIGIVNTALDWLGASRLAFFGSEDLAIPTIAFVNVWRHMGYTALLIFAGLQMIPPTVYEAASVDGASEWRTFWSITLPLLRPVLVLVLIITVTGSFQVFDTVAVTTGGGPVNASRVIQVYIVERAFERSDFGYASALSVVLFVILAVIAFAQNKWLRGGESDLA
ncbi:carbohydrate ABC transporter permease [Aquipuribacter nitratireducens]|uniref:Carbohydrate ABC transporter permease n=1 Tax=Aquipuribacter nitratireducens TaxID=650104 RepID=A0ABW0GII6_9MICO